MFSTSPEASGLHRERLISIINADKRDDRLRVALLGTAQRVEPKITSGMRHVHASRGASRTRARRMPRSDVNPREQRRYQSAWLKV